jgi:hypothetical protein
VKSTGIIQTKPGNLYHLSINVSMSSGNYVFPQTSQE